MNVNWINKLICKIFSCKNVPVKVFLNTIPGGALKMFRTRAMATKHGAKTSIPTSAYVQQCLRCGTVRGQGNASKPKLVKNT